MSFRQYPARRAHTTVHPGAARYLADEIPASSDSISTTPPSSSTLGNNGRAESPLSSPKSCPPTPRPENLASRGQDDEERQVRIVTELVDGAIRSYVSPKTFKPLRAIRNPSLPANGFNDLVPLVFCPGFACSLANRMSDMPRITNFLVAFLQKTNNHLLSRQRDRLIVSARNGSGKDSDEVPGASDRLRILKEELHRHIWQTAVNCLRSRFQPPKLSPLRPVSRKDSDLEDRILQGDDSEVQPSPPRQPSPSAPSDLETSSNLVNLGSLDEPNESSDFEELDIDEDDEIDEDLIEAHERRVLYLRSLNSGDSLDETVNDDFETSPDVDSYVLESGDDVFDDQSGDTAKHLAKPELPEGFPRGALLDHLPTAIKTREAMFNSSPVLLNDAELVSESEICEHQPASLSSPAHLLVSSPACANASLSPSSSTMLDVTNQSPQCPEGGWTSELETDTHTGLDMVIERDLFAVAFEPWEIQREQETGSDELLF